jgi:hypothetical protein
MAAHGVIADNVTKHVGGQVEIIRTSKKLG